MMRVSVHDRSEQPGQRRRGAASLVLSIALLLMVTAALVTTMRGRWARHHAQEGNDSRRVVIAAIDAAMQLPRATLAKEVRLPLASTSGAADHFILISLIEEPDHQTTIRAAEWSGGKVGLQITRPWKENEK